jgi:hypothetical protein
MGGVGTFFEEKACQRSDFFLRSPGTTFSEIMPFYDEPGVRFDDPLVRYDDPRTYEEILNELNPTPTTMAYDIVLDIDDLSVPELLARATAIKGAVGGIAAFASLADDLTALQTQIDSTRSQQDDIAACEAAVAAAVTVRNTTNLPALKGAIKTVAKGVGELATSEAMVLEATLRLRAKASPRPVPDRPTGLELSYGDEPGELGAQCNGQPGLVDYYEVRVTTSDPNGPEPGWQYREPSRKSTFDLTGLPSGAMVWVAVRACNAQGKSPWSDPASKRVP